MASAMGAGVVSVGGVVCAGEPVAVVATLVGLDTVTAPVVGTAPAVVGAAVDTAGSTVSIGFALELEQLAAISPKSTATDRRWRMDTTLPQQKTPASCHKSACQVVTMRRRNTS